MNFKKYFKTLRKTLKITEIVTLIIWTSVVLLICIIARILIALHLIRDEDLKDGETSQSSL